jgi:hypothetical protein
MPSSDRIFDPLIYAIDRFVAREIDKQTTIVTHVSVSAGSANPSDSCFPTHYVQFMSALETGP